MAITTKIIVQQILNIDDTKATASKFPRYTVTLGNSISSITANELVSSIEAAAKSAAAAKDSEIAAKTSELNAKESENDAAISAGASEASATQSATSATQSAASATKSAESAAAAKTSETNSKTSETNAKTSETNADESAAAAKISEGNAKISETNAAQSAADSSGFRNEAEIFSEQAAASASAAKISETNAKTSETKAKASETNAAGSATSASQSVTTIQGLKSDVEQLKSDTQAIKNSAVTETAALKADVEQLKSDTQNIKDSAVSETQAIKDAAVSETTAIKDAAVSETTAIKDAAAASAAQASNSATEAGQQASNAASSAQSAAADAGRAEVAAGKAEQVISQAVLKDNNLSDLSNFEIARQNMRVAPYDTDGNHSFIYSPNKSYRLVIRNDGLLVYQNGDGTDTKPFEIGAGGTGATTVQDARNNLGLGTAQDVQFKSITATDGDILVPQTHIVGCRTGEGGDKRIYLMNIGGDSEPGGLVNLLQGNWYDGYWQLGGIRGEGTNLKNVHLYINPNKSGYSGSNFSFIPEPNDAQASGYVRSPRGFMGRCYMGGWDAAADNRLTPFWADTVTKNNTAWSPIVSGGSMSDGGYYMRTSLGIISSSAADWPEVSIHMLGDGRYHRAYSFNKSGGIYSWGNDPWGGNYDFAKNPTSDRDLKHDIQYTDGKESYDRVMQWLPTMFKYNGSDIQRFGLIAQDLLKIDPQYVKLVPGSPVFEDVIGVDENGEEYIDRQIETDRKDDTLALDSNVILTDMACAMVYMGGMIEKQQKEIDELKAAVAALLNK